MTKKVIIGDATLFLADCMDVLPTLEGVDCVITDPPYGISFMNKKWDYAIPEVEIWEAVLGILKPGAYALIACGTRTQHRMAVNIEDAGFEIRDLIAWVYGSGFPKSLNISKAIDKKAGVEMETRGHIGFTHETKGAFRTNEERKNPGIYRREPVTDEAKQWDGWGTGLKPACEYWTWVTKPLYDTQGYAIIDSIENNLGELIWQSLKKSQKQDTFKLLEMVLIPLSIALLWHNILGELYSSENKSIILTESKAITELKILNSLLSKNMQKGTDGKFQISQNGIPKYQTDGLNALANSAVKILEGLNHTKKDSEIITFIATEIVSLRIKNIGLNVPNVDGDLETLNAIVSSVLQNVLTDIIRGKEKKKLSTLVEFAEKLLQLSLVENPSIAVEDAWQGLSENLSPDMNLWTLCRKPLSEKTVVENVLKHGTGGINIDGCKINFENESDSQVGTDIKRGDKRGISSKKSLYGGTITQEGVQMYKDNGRFPANFIHDGSDEVLENFPDNANPDKRIIKLARSGKGSKGIYGDYGADLYDTPAYGDSGSAARFFYTAKASKSERGKDNDHPTVKPIKLMQYLITLITPPNGIVLDPFMGSGSTGVACARLGRKFIGVEIDERYFKIACERIDREYSQGKLFQ